LVIKNTTLEAVESIHVHKTIRGSKNQNKIHKSDYGIYSLKEKLKLKLQIPCRTVITITNKETRKTTFSQYNTNMVRAV